MAERLVYQRAAVAAAGPHAVGGALWVADRADLCGLVLPVSAVLWPGQRAGGGRRGAGRGDVERFLGDDICTMQALLGHKNVSTTKIYTHVMNRPKVLPVRSPLDGFG